MLNKDIARRLLEVEDLPTLPEVMNHILEVVESENSSAQDLTTILETDHAISARVLRLANSAFYGLRHRADSIRRAVVVVGFEAVRMLALATTVFDTLSSRKQFAIAPDDFWMHSLGTAKAAQLLSNHCRTTSSQEGCFTAGLLHDMGKYVLALVLKEKYQEVVRAAEENQINLLPAEQERLEANHAEVGLWLARRWRFPSMICDAIGHQYRVESYNGEYPTEVAIIALSSELSRQARFGDAGDFAPVHIHPAEPIASSMDTELIPSILEELADYRAEARRFLNMLQGD
jgi:HD-like signal output (HDOD) protein